MPPPFDCDVAIVGYGPVGATLANLLGLCGVSTWVLERETDAYPLPRAVAFDDEIMRLFQTIGLAQAILPHTHVSPGMHFVDADGRLLLDWPRPPAPGPQGWHTGYRFHQPDLERVLRAGVARWPTVRVLHPADAVAVAADADGVSLAYDDAALGRRHCRARYVVGCDGARSAVRSWIGGGMEDLGFHERWLVVDMILRRPVPALGDYSVQYCNPDRPATYVRGVGARRRWEITLRPGEDDDAAMTAPDTIHRLLAPWITRDDADIERAACYAFHSTLARRWRAGRLLIAGDAAHQTPPFLGQGMCAGLRDVSNLAWKLARVVRHDAPDTLLDSYPSERAPHVRAYIELAIRLGGLINATAIQAALPGGPADETPRMALIRPRLGPGISAGWNGPTGQIAPQPVLADGTRLDDRIGYRHALLTTPAFAAALPSEMRLALERQDIQLIADDAPALRDWLNGIGAPAALLRPDRYVLGAARTTTEAIALLEAACA